MIIHDCDIIGSTNGITINAGTYASYGGTIANSRIIVSNNCIYDYSGRFIIINNRCFTKQAKGAYGEGAILCGAYMAQDNRVTCSDVNNAVLPAQGTL